MTDILEIEKPKYLKLADGKEYELPALHLTTLANMEKTMGFGLGQLHDKMVTETAQTLRVVIYALLKETDPRLDIEECGKLVPLDMIRNITDVLTKILAISM